MSISQDTKGAGKDVDFAPVRLGAEIDRPPAFGSLLIMGVALFLVVAVLWADWAVLDEVTTGQGRVIPSSQVQVVQNLEGGIVREIRVREGEIVKKGQVLLQIENTAFVASYGELRAKSHGLMATIARLKAEAHQTPLEFPEELLKEAPQLVARERALYEARQSELKAQLSVFEQQAAQRKQELTELHSRQSHLSKAVELIQEEIRITSPLVDQGVVPRIELIRLQRQLSEQQRELDAVRLAKPRARSAMREANRRIQERFLGFKAEAQLELTTRQNELAAVREAIVAARDRVQRTEVRSPVRGIVKQVKVSTVGGVVRPSADLVEIVPLDDTLLVEAKVRPQDIAFISPEQDATVKITAYDFSIYGGLKAKVERISADAITESDGNGREESYYKIIVRTQRNYLGTKDKPLPIIPGMVASVDILTGKKSVLDYLLKPVLKAKNRALRER